MKITGQSYDRCTGCSDKVCAFVRLIQRPVACSSMLLSRWASDKKPLMPLRVPPTQIVNAYETDGFSFLLQAFDDASFLERVTGLDLMAQETEGVMESLEWSEDEEDNEAGI